MRRSIYIHYLRVRSMLMPIYILSRATTTYASPVAHSSKLGLYYFFKGHPFIKLFYCYGTPPWHLTYVYLFPPTQQLETDYEIAAIYSNLRQSAIFCHILPTCSYRNIYNICDVRNVHDFCRTLPSLPNSTKFCQDYDLNPILPYKRVN